MPEIESYNPRGGRIVKEDSSVVNEADLQETLVGKNPHYINDTELHEGDWQQIQVIETCIFDTFTSGATGNAITGYPPGVYSFVGANITDVELASGIVQMYE